MEKSWIQLPSPDLLETQRLADEHGLELITANLLFKRGCRTKKNIDDFFRPDLSQLHDPFLMKDMDMACNRLQLALDNGESILLYGDYDVDGTTAVSLMFGFLKGRGAICDYYIPDRYTEGYGFSSAAVHWAKAKGFSLIITLDCGIKDGPRIEEAKAMGIDVVVCDHHEPSEIPKAVAVLDPKRPDCSYPFDGLSGCGVGFKLLQALCIRCGYPIKELYQYLDLLAISIGADIVPIVDENRIFTYWGLRLLNKRRKPGIDALLKCARFEKSAINISDVVFTLAPRINAAGRIFNGRQAVALLSAEGEIGVEEISTQMESNNEERRRLDKLITREAVEMALYSTRDFSTIVQKDDWHKGVIGIVASRLVETYYKPAIVLTLQDGKLSGSARSIPGVDLYKALGKCENYLLQYGGHTMAAGLSMLPQNFDAFSLQFEKVVAEMVQHVKPTPVFEYEEEITMNMLNHKFFSELESMAPFGPGNMNPVFRMKCAKDGGNSKQVGAEGSHLRLHLKDVDTEISLFGIAFGFGHLYSEISAGNTFELLFTFEKNTFKGRTNWEFHVKDIRME